MTGPHDLAPGDWTNCTSKDSGGGLALSRYYRVVRIMGKSAWVSLDDSCKPIGPYPMHCFTRSAAPPGLEGQPPQVKMPESLVPLDKNLPALQPSHLFRKGDLVRCADPGGLKDKVEQDGVYKVFGVNRNALIIGLPGARKSMGSYSASRFVMHRPIMPGPPPPSLSKRIEDFLKEQIEADPYMGGKDTQMAAQMLRQFFNQHPVLTVIFQESKNGTP